MLSEFQKHSPLGMTIYPIAGETPLSVAARLGEYAKYERINAIVHNGYSDPVGDMCADFEPVERFLSIHEEIANAITVGMSGSCGVAYFHVIK